MADDAQDGGATREELHEKLADAQERLAELEATISRLLGGEDRTWTLSQVCEQVSDCILITDLNNKITYANQAFSQQYGYSPQELIGQSPDILNAEEAAPEIQKEIYQTVLSGRAWAGEVKNRRSDGSTFACELQVFALVGADGETFAYAGIQRDITQRKQAEARRLASERELNELQKLESLGLLAGGIAHDFNNLLTGILGNAQLMLEETPPGSTARAYLEPIEQAGRRAAALTHQMLAYCGAGRFLLEDIDVNRCVAEITDLLSASMSKKVGIAYALDADVSPVRGDATQLQQVIMNLVLNASEAIGDRPGSIRVSTREINLGTADWERLKPKSGPLNTNIVVCEVADTGVGMDDETRSKMFDPFFTTKFTGRGLGLAATMGIVKAHGGDIRVESEPGGGTTIRVSLPTIGVGQRPSAEPPVTELAPGPEARGVVLLVDDELYVRDVGANMLRRLGAQVVLAADGIEALDRLAEPGEPFQCVFLDLTMPRMDGTEALRQIKERWPETPVFLTSGYSEHELSERFAGSGTAGIIQKPYTIEVLHGALQTVTKP